ncbi:MAG: hypothetical protein SOU05_06760 [Atopobium sp.]|uniref:hypothetical protein n=1 Tax=Atopobium sp. TaxID=1872650 RepID=UPI002A7580EA|nr:hypothetical protein [Atopobium sp.]MDY2789085.1 hypothetical protein [Atopobium sp.]
MTREERAVTWLKNLPEAQKLSMEERIKICDRVAKGTGVVFLGLLVAEFLSLYLLSNGAVFDWMADTINNFATNSYGTRKYRSLALLGVLLYIPLFVLPIVVGAMYRKRQLKVLVGRALVDNKEVSTSEID